MTADPSSGSKPSAAALIDVNDRESLSPRIENVISGEPGRRERFPTLKPSETMLSFWSEKPKSALTVPSRNAEAVPSSRSGRWKLSKLSVPSISYPNETEACALSLSIVMRLFPVSTMMLNG